MTTITESFNQTDSTTLGPDLSWTELSGTWETKSNAVAKTVGTNQYDRARADSDLASSDHYSQVVMAFPVGGTYHGPACRMASDTANTFYGLVSSNSDPISPYLIKFVAGSQTNLSSGSTAVSAGQVHKVEANGTAIKGYFDGIETNGVTDSSIPGNVRCGFCSASAQNGGLMDSFQAADLAAPPAGGFRSRIAGGLVLVG